MRTVVFVVVLLIGLGASSHSLVLAGTPRMTTEQLTALISGTTVYGTNSRGKSFVQILGTDGSLESGPVKKTLSGKTKKWVPTEFGTWKVRDGKLCNTYTKPQSRDGGCDAFHTSDTGKYIYYTDSGGMGSFDKIVKGRAE